MGESKECKPTPKERASKVACQVVCRLCQKEFPSQKELDQHMKKEHGTPAVKTS